MRRSVCAIIAALLTGCSAVSGIEQSASERAKQPITVTLYHGHF